MARLVTPQPERDAVALISAESSIGSSGISKRRRGRPRGSETTSECCNDRLRAWYVTPCLCDCHYPSISARDMLEQLREEDVQAARGIPFKNTGGGSATPRRRMRGRKRILERDNYTCVYCGDPATHVDHVKPYGIYGPRSTRDDNMVASCAPCNLMASGSDFDSFEIKRAYIRQARKLADDEVETA